MKTPSKTLRQLLKVRKAVGRDNLPLTLNRYCIDVDVLQAETENLEAYFDYQAKQITDLKI